MKIEKIRICTEYNTDYSINNLSLSNDLLNRLAKVEVDGLQNGKTLASYQYNAFSQRIQKDVNGAKTIFIYNSAGQLLEEQNKQQNTTRDYIYVDGQLIAAIENGIISYITTDHLNAPQIITSQTGQTIWSAKYDPFGKATVTGNIKYNLRADGQYQDDETGLYYNWYRYYNPELGRYITSDPLGLQAGINTYVYVNGNPINYTDPMGMWGWNSNAGGSIELMTPYGGFGATLSISFGYYWNSKYGILSGQNGTAITAGGFIGLPGHALQYPQVQKNSPYSMDKTHWGYGAEVGGGIGVSGTNATCINDEYGYSDNLNFNSILNSPLSGQISKSGSIYTDSLTAGVGIGSNVSTYPTDTQSPKYFAHEIMNQILGR